MEPRILHFVHHALPMQTGYTIRTQRIATNQQLAGCHVSVARDLFGASDGMASGTGDPCSTTRIDEIPYISPGTFRGRATRNRVAEFARLPGVRWVNATISLPGYVNCITRAVGRPDLVHAHSPHYTLRQGVKVARRLGIPVVAEVRGFWNLSMSAESGSRPDIERAIRPDARAASACDHVIAICDGIAEQLERAGIPSRSIDIVPNGVDTGRFQPKDASPDLRSALRLKDALVFGCATNVRRLEGIQTIIDAWPTIQKKLPNAVFLLVGDGDFRESLQHMVESRGFSGSWRFTGSVPYERTPDYYDLMDIYVLPRTPDPVCQIVTPLKLLEALSMALPVIVGDCAALRENVNNDVTGVLFPAADASALASACIRLGEQPALRRMLGNNARRWVMRNRDWTRVVDRYREIYERLPRR